MSDADPLAEFFAAQAREQELLKQALQSVTGTAATQLYDFLTAQRAERELLIAHLAQLTQSKNESE